VILRSIYETDEFLLVAEGPWIEVHCKPFETRDIEESSSEDRSESSDASSADKSSTKNEDQFLFVFIGIGAGALLLIAGATAAAIFFVKRRRNQRGISAAAGNEGGKAELHKEPIAIEMARSPSMDLARSKGRSPPPVAQRSVLLDDIEVKYKIGQGNYGEIYYGIWNGQTPVALKKLKSDKTKQFDSEAGILTNLNHPCVIHVRQNFFVCFFFCFWR
jgi:hypothetical protein